VLGHGGHRLRLHGLQQHGADATDVHRRVAVHPGDRAPRGEPAWTRGAVDTLAVPVPVGPGDPREQCRAQPPPDAPHVLEPTGVGEALS
jgi:hypothetical protein